MNVQEYTLPEIQEIAESLFADRSVIAVTPTGGDSDWASSAAWSIARAAAATGRRTALIDLYVDDPRLQALAYDPQDTGIVDAFLFGASLQHVASQDENPNLHFIGVGTPSADTEGVLTNKRWQRLSRGFSKEEAVLVLFLPTASLDLLSLEPDLILAVSPTGFGPSGPQEPQIRSAIDRGMTVCVIKDQPEVIPSEQSPGTGPGSRIEMDWRRLLLIVVSVAGTAAVAGAILVMSGRDSPQDAMEAPVAPVDTADTRLESAPDTEPQDEESLPVVPTPAGPVDTLAYSIQVAAWSQLSEAFGHFAELTGAGVSATISAVPRDSARAWYRVFVGAVPDQTAARELRSRLRADGIIGSVRGVLANTPYAYLLATRPDSLSGQRAAEGLREIGIPAYIVSMPDGSVQVLVGAFESPDQTELADSVIPEAGRGLSKVLVTRVGIAR